MELLTHFIAGERTRSAHQLGLWMVARSD